MKLNEDKLASAEKTLIVTGNGFDLKWGLKSSYSDFYDWCKEQVNGFDNMIELISQNVSFSSFDRFQKFRKFFRAASNQTTTVWDLYLIMHSRPSTNQWHNIEELIVNSFESGFWDKVYKEFYNFSQSPNYSKDSIESLFGAIMMDRYFTNWFAEIEIGKKETSEESFYVSLLNELNKFEKRFGFYIEEQFQSSSEYINNQNNLLDKLLNETSNSSDYKIVSFNYTPYYKVDHLNIHGTYKQPILGISIENSTHKYASMFTKPFRRIVNNLSRIQRFIGDDYVHVIFYGASLSDLDLDHYKLILEKESIKKIYFCYSEYDGPNRRKKFIRAVHNLIDKIFSNQIYDLYDKKEVIEIVKI